MHQEAGELRLSSFARSGCEQFSGISEAAGPDEFVGLSDGVERGWGWGWGGGGFGFGRRGRWCFEEHELSAGVAAHHAPGTVFGIFQRSVAFRTVEVRH